MTGSTEEDKDKTLVIQGNMYPSDFEAKKMMIEAGRQLDQKNYTVAGDGSMSVRVGPNAVWFCLDGADKAALRQEDFLRTDLNGKAQLARNGQRLPEDYLLHLEVYRQNDRVRCILHSYPASVTAMGLKGCGAEPADFSPSVEKLGRIRCVDPAAPEELARTAGKLCKESQGMIIGKGGCVMWSESVRKAFQLTQALDYYESVRKASGCCESRSCATCDKFRNGSCGRPAGSIGGQTAPAGTGAGRGSAGPAPEGVTPIIHPGEAFDFKLPENGSGTSAGSNGNHTDPARPQPAMQRTGTAMDHTERMNAGRPVPAPHPVTISSPSNHFATDWENKDTGYAARTTSDSSRNKPLKPVTISMPPSNLTITKAVNAPGRTTGDVRAAAAAPSYQSSYKENRTSVNTANGAAAYRAPGSAGAPAPDYGDREAQAAAPLHGTAQASAQCPSNVAAGDKPLPYVRKDGPVRNAPRDEIMAEVVRRTIAEMKF